MILEARKLQRLSRNKIEQMIGVDGTIYKAYDDDREPADSEIVRNLIGTLGIRQQWWDKDWESGSKDIFITHDENPPPIAGKPIKGEPLKLLQDALAEGSDYRVIPKTILDGEYRIFPKSEIEQRTKELEARSKEQEDLRRERIETIDAKNKLIKRLEDEIAELRAGKPVTPQSTQ